MIEGYPTSLNIDVVHDFPFAYESAYTLIGEEYIDRGELFVLVFSVRSRSSLAHVLLHHSHIARKKEFTHHWITIVANHCAGLLEPSELDVLVEGEELAKQLGCKFCTVTSFDPSTIGSALCELVQEKQDFERREHYRRREVQLQKERERTLEWQDIKEAYRIEPPTPAAYANKQGKRRHRIIKRFKAAAALEVIEET